MTEKLQKTISSGFIPWALLTVAQILLTFFPYDPQGIPSVRTIGWVVWWASASLGWIPIMTLRMKGTVASGQSYVKTTRLVDSGLYAVIRHPQYLSFLLVNLALILISQQWAVALLGVPAIAFVWMAILPGADREGLEKFGANYQRYMQSVPRANFIAGIIRLLRRWREARATQSI